MPNIFNCIRPIVELQEKARNLAVDSLNNPDHPASVILSEECDPEVSTAEWFEQIFNAI